MVGLDKFREAFHDFSDNYVIIGGTACDIVMSGTVVRPRATHDIDMIIVTENMTPDFGKRFWDFIKAAGYRPERRKTKESERPKYEFYRFVDGKEGFPKMIELLSRHPISLDIPANMVVTPLPISDDISSLSAIMMDDDFYHFTIRHSTLTDGVRHALPASLIALKAKAYLNLLADKSNGFRVNTHNIKKHRTDVLKSAVLVEEDSISAPQSIVDCVREFVASLRNDSDTIMPAMAKALDTESEVVVQLLDQLDNLFHSSSTI